MKKVFLILFLVLSIFLFFGCTQSENTTDLNKVSPTVDVSENKNVNPNAVCSNEKYSGVRKDDGVYLEPDFDTAYDDLSDISDLTCLTVLILKGSGDLDDVSPIGNLVNLTELRFLSTLDSRTLTFDFSDISSFDKLVNLKVLDVSDSGVGDVSVLSKLTKLEELNLSNTSVSDISSIQGLTNLKKLGLWGVKVSDFSAIKNLKNLEYLDLSYSNFDEVSLLSDLALLKELKIGGTSGDGWDLANIFLGLTDVSSLSNLKNLETLHILGSMNLSDISSISGLTKLKELYLGFNRVTDLSILKNLTNIETLILFPYSSDPILYCMSKSDDFKECADKFSAEFCMNMITNQSNACMAEATALPNLSFLKDLEKIKVLTLGIEGGFYWPSNNPNLSDLSSLMNLEELDIADLLNISDLSSIMSLPKLKKIYCGFNEDYKYSTVLNQLKILDEKGVEITCISYGEFRGFKGRV